jgi:hypothetical protein
MAIEPYLFFNGRCEDAIEFYKKALGAEVLMLMRYKESPEPPPPGMVPPGWENKIMHTSLRIGNATVPTVAARGQIFKDFHYRYRWPTRPKPSTRLPPSRMAVKCGCRSPRLFGRRASACSPTASVSGGWSQLRPDVRRMEPGAIKSKPGLSAKAA